MKVIDVIEKCEKDLTTEELIDLVANHNRQVDLILAEKKTDEDGYLTWDAKNGPVWTVSGLSAATPWRVASCLTSAATTSMT